MTLHVHLLVGRSVIIFEKVGSVTSMLLSEHLFRHCQITIDRLGLLYSEKRGIFFSFSRFKPKMSQADCEDLVLQAVTQVKKIRRSYILSCIK